MGKYNIHLFMSLLNAFGIDHAVLYDGDSGESRDTVVTKTITDATGAFTKRVKCFDQDLKTELGIVALSRTEKHRKPQYVLYNLETGLIAKNNLDSVIDELRQLCLP